MGIDKHTMQQWVAGAEICFKKERKPFSSVPFVNRIGVLADTSQEYQAVEKIDLTRARNFRTQQTAEDLMVASIDLPLIGKRGVGNDIGLAVATFDYTDKDGDEHSVIAICAYCLSGVVSRTRELKKVIAIPVG